VGSVLIVEPEGHGLTSAQVEGTTALMPLNSTALQISTLGHDALTVRHQLDAALARCGPRWGTGMATSWSAVPR
jgi:hypothetical protein